MYVSLQQRIDATSWHISLHNSPIPAVLSATKLNIFHFSMSFYVFSFFTRPSLRKKARGRSYQLDLSRFCTRPSLKEVRGGHGRQQPLQCALDHV